jgi:DNA-binding CsgD family transcriptional regulator/RecA/RadA recombinase
VTHRSSGPLVGRAAELDALRALYRDACDGIPRVVLLWGEAGVGKTRLLHELVAHAERSGSRVGAGVVFPYACPPFAPLREAFASLQLSDVFDIDDPSSPSPEPPEHTKYRRFVEATRSLRSGSETAPLLLTLDDVQWADMATLEFLSYLVSHGFRTGQAPVRALIVAVARSDDIERDHARSELFARLRKDGIATLAVDPLGDDEIRELVVALWPGAQTPEAEVDRVCALAEGKPFFAEELVHSAASGLPPSIRGGVLARLAILDSQHHDVLRHAAVIGVRFDPALLAQLVGRPVAEIWSVLEAARNAQLVAVPSGHATEVAFRHAITREIIYAELLPPQARTMHAQVAAMLAERRDVDPERLAYHFTAAGDRERATIANEAAGDAAASRGAHRDAAIAYRQAIDLCDPADEAHRYAGLCERLARTQLLNGALDEACTWGQRALDLYIALDDRARSGPLGVWLSRRFTDAGRDIEKAVALVESVLHRASPEEAALRYSALIALAYLSFHRGRTAAALEQLAQADAIPGVLALEERHLFYDVRAEVRAHDRHLGSALKDGRAAIEIARKIGSVERLSITLCNYARFAFFAGDNVSAIDAYREAVELSERAHLTRASALVKRSLSFVYLLTGDLANAERTLKESRAASGGVVADTAVVSIGLRIASLRDDEAAAARFTIDEALERAFSSAQTQSIGPLAGSVAAYWDARGRRTDARALRSRALPFIRNAALALWLVDQLASSADQSEVNRARGLLEAIAADADHAVGAAHLALFDARVARQRRDVRETKARAADAAARFAAVGWPWEEAQALELAGDLAGALGLYQRHGFVRDERRLAEARRRLRHRTRSTALTPRETEVVRLAVAGFTNRAIAEILFISERTVETHIASVFDRFDLTSRAQLARLEV